MKSSPDQKCPHRAIAIAVALTALAFAAACGSNDEPGGNPVPPANAGAFAKCMRENGVADYPDPKPGEEAEKNIDVNSPTFKKAAEACKNLKGTPPKPS